MRLLQMSVSGVLLIILTALLRKAALHILPKRAFLFFWGIVLIRLLVPFPPVIRVPLPETISEQRAAVPMENPPAGDLGRTNPSASPRPVQPPTGAAVRDAAENGSAPKSRENRISSWPVVIRTVWTAGAVSMGLFFLLAYAAGYRKFRQAYPVEHGLARAWMAAHPLRRAYAVKSFGDTDAPMTWGVLRPVILAPGLETWWSSPEAKFALEHEYIHMRRFDAALKFALALALSLHWFNPAVWVFYALANRDMELSCDEAVLLRFGERERGAYARALLSAEERRQELPVLYAGFGTDTTRERIVEIMKFKKKSAGSVVLAAVLALALAACSAAGGTAEAQGAADGFAAAGESLDINNLALRPDGAASRIVENDAMRLPIPLEYGDLLVVETPQDNESGILFSVSEKASMDAAAAEYGTDEGAGWLFSVNRISEDAFHEAVCYDMSGEEVFAKDGDGYYYMYCHPTDVRFVRENYEDIDEDMAQWSMLNQWAAAVPDNFILENPGLTPEKRTNTPLDMYLARIAWLDGTNYTISNAEYGAMNPNGLDPSPWLFRLMDGAAFAWAEGETAPDGDYVVLNFPDEDVRFDFFLADGKENLIRMVWNDDMDEVLYRANYADDTRAGVVMREWYDALVSAKS